MSDLGIYRDGSPSQSSNHSNTYQTVVPGKIQAVKQRNKNEESEITLKIVDKTILATGPPKKNKKVLKEDSVICITKKEALGMC